MNSTNNTFIFSLEGNIGVGKSTIINLLKLNKFKFNKKFVYLEEPVNMWEDVKDENGINILENYYKNTKEYAFKFQMLVYISRLSLLRKTIKENHNSIILIERSIYADKNIFVKMLYDNNKIDKIEYEIYNKLFNQFLDDVNISGIIYLQCNADICLKRIKKRNRLGENISIQYLENCDKYHENWINNLKIPVSVLNCNIDIKNNPHIVSTWILNIFEFIEKSVNKELKTNNHHSTSS